MFCGDAGAQPWVGPSTISSDSSVLAVVDAVNGTDIAARTVATTLAAIERTREA